MKLSRVLEQENNKLLINGLIFFNAQKILNNVKKNCLTNKLKNLSKKIQILNSKSIKGL